MAAPWHAILRRHGDDEDPPVVGAVFEASDGTRFIFGSAGTLHEAESLAAEASSKMTTILAVALLWNAGERLDCRGPRILEPEPDGEMTVN